MDSDEGVQQGDPLGPFLFSLALEALTAEIHAKCPDLALHAWYLDDGVVGGRTADVLRACDIVQESAGRIGLDLNFAKCEVIFHRKPRDDPFPKDVVLEDGTIARPGYKRIYTSPNGGVDLLGTPIGADAFVDDYVQRKVLKRCVEAFAAVETLEDPHVAYCLLRSTCGFSKLVHIIRTVPPSQACKGARAFDDLLRAWRYTFRCRGPHGIRPVSPFLEGAWVSGSLPFTGAPLTSRLCRSARASTGGTRPRADTGRKRSPTTTAGWG